MMRTVAPDVHLLRLGVVNVHLVEAGKSLIAVDGGFPGRARQIVDAVRSLRGSADALTDIVVSHAHPDHAGSVAALAAVTGATVWAHPDSVPALAGIEPSPPLTPAPTMSARVLHAALARRGSSFDPVHVDRTVSDGDAIAASTLQVVHLPGHCPGQIGLHDAGRGLLFVADAFGHRRRRLTHPLGYADLGAGRRDVHRLRSLQATTVLFGHGPAASGWPMKT